MVRMMLTGLVVLSLLMLAMVQSVEAKATPIKGTELAKGSLDDETLAKAAPANEMITTEKDLEKLWKAWKLGDKMPTVDFKKEIVFVSTTVGSRLSPSVSLDDKGNLNLLALATRDIRPGFRYVVISVPLEGVKTINGKELPK